MKVQRFMDRTRGISTVEPPLDPEWSPLMRLDWKCSLVMHDAGIWRDRVSVAEAMLEVNGEPAADVYEVTIGRSQWGPLSYEQTWSFLNGIAGGLELARAADRG